MCDWRSGISEQSDHELFQVSTYTLIRNQDLAAVTSERFKQWIQENNIELISYRDLKGM